MNFNPGGVNDNFYELFDELNNQKLNPNILSKTIFNFINENKINYEGIFTFEYLKNEEDLLAQVLNIDIIANEEISEKECENFYNYILSFNKNELNKLIKNLNLLKNFPFEISRYWARLYTL